jgi:hypothetical protein
VTPPLLCRQGHTCSGGNGGGALVVVVVPVINDNGDAGVVSHNVAGPKSLS